MRTLIVLDLLETPEGKTRERIRVGESSGDLANVDISPSRTSSNIGGGEDLFVFQSRLTLNLPPSALRKSDLKSKSKKVLRPKLYNWGPTLNDVNKRTLQ